MTRQLDRLHADVDRGRADDDAGRLEQAGVPGETPYPQ